MPTLARRAFVRPALIVALASGLLAASLAVSFNAAALDGNCAVGAGADTPATTCVDLGGR